MAKITISARLDDPSARLVKDLRGLVSGGGAQISAALKNGDPLLDGELFDRPRVEVFSVIRQLLLVLESHGVEPQVWEAGRPISSQVLRNIMTSSEDSAREFDRLAGFGHEA
jgi:hypothetical protein